MSKRNFYKTVIQVEVLCEESPFEWDDLNSVAYAINSGECSGSVREISTNRLTGAEAAKALQAQGSGTEFFRLDADGNDVED